MCSLVSFKVWYLSNFVSIHGIVISGIFQVLSPSMEVLAISGIFPFLSPSMENLAITGVFQFISPDLESLVNFGSFFLRGFCAMPTFWDSLNLMN
jgi:hypothetical protein